MRIQNLMSASFVAVLFSLAVFSSSTLAENPTVEFVPLQERAQGRSLAGASLLNDSLYSNPAASAFTQVYSIDANYLPSGAFSFSVLDTKTSALGGALGYFRRPMDVRQGLLEGVKVALNHRSTEEFAFGISPKILWGPNSSQVSTRLTDFDFGALANFTVVKAGMAIKNVLGGNAAIEQSREWTAGARVGWQETLFLSGAVNGRWAELKPYQYGVGAEYVSPYYFSLKGGFRFYQPGEVGLGFWSFGASLNTPRLSLHYAMEVPAQGEKGPEHIFGATLLM